MEWIEVKVVPTLLASFVCLMLGYVLGSRAAYRMKRQAKRAMSTQAIELLDVRSSLRRLERYASRQQRRERLLKLTLRKLQAANKRTQQLEKLLEDEKRRNFSMISRLRLAALSAQESASSDERGRPPANVHWPPQKTVSPSPLEQTFQNSAPQTDGAVDPVPANSAGEACSVKPRHASPSVSKCDSSPFSGRCNNNRNKLRGAHSAPAS